MQKLGVGVLKGNRAQEPILHHKMDIMEAASKPLTRPTTGETQVV